MRRTLGELETRFISYAQMRRATSVRVGELGGSILGLSPSQERALLSRLARKGVIARVRNGFYLVPPTLPLGGAWTPAEFVALEALMDDAGAEYQVCGPSAFNFHGFDEQTPNRVYAYNTMISGARKIGAIQLTLIKVNASRLGDTDSITSESGDVPISSRARTLFDAVYDWSRFNGIPRAFDWIRRDLASGRTSARALVSCTVRYGDVGAKRRMGVLLEREGVPERLLRELERELEPSTGSIAWLPGKPKRGKLDQRWRVVINDAR